MIQKPTAVLTRHDGTNAPLDVNLAGREPSSWSVPDIQRLIQQIVLLAIDEPSVAVEHDEAGVTFVVRVGGNVLRVGPMAGVNPELARAASLNPLGVFKAAVRGDNRATVVR
jgi:hypothetical protein